MYVRLKKNYYYNNDDNKNNVIDKIYVQFRLFMHTYIASLVLLLKNKNIHKVNDTMAS